LADYFSPNNQLSHASSGTGQPFGGHTAFDNGALVSDRGSVEIIAGKRPIKPPSDEVESETESSDQTHEFTQHGPQAHPTEGEKHPAKGAAPTGQADNGKAAVAARQPTEAEIRAEKERQEREAMAKAAEQIQQAVRDDPALAEIAKQLKIDMTPDGLRIQIVDEVKLPMFATGSSELNERARMLLKKVVPVLEKLPKAISIAGHTDAVPYAAGGKTNWELSAERANATRRILVEGGLAEARFRTVTGHADRDPLIEDDPFAAANRRISILVLKDRGA
jgi:chemotaxis protein MotB